MVMSWVIVAALAAAADPEGSELLPRETAAVAPDGGETRLPEQALGREAAPAAVDPRFPKLGWLLFGQGIALEAVAAIHFVALPLLHGWFASELQPQQLSDLWPAFSLDHTVVGILLVPLGLSTILAAYGVRHGEKWGWALAMINAVSVVALPIAMGIIMGPQYFQAPAFSISAALVTAVAASMGIPLLVTRSEFF